MEISRIKLTLFAILCQLFLSDAVEVTTPRGKIVGSENLKTRNGRKIFSFSGIPFAKPPVGTLRFKEPQPLGPWKEPLDATKDGPECPQIPNPEVNPSQLITGKEDCLNLNVYSPKVDAKAKLPVMFYIHGGGYQQGSGHRSLYGPEFLLDRDIVLVTANYRLAILGFATTGDDSIPGNLGLKDQSFALKWVHDNIEHFGGDPNLVTVFGESAGGASTHLSILSPLNKGLVHRGISMSGTALCTWAVAPLQLIKDRTKAVATITGCPTEPSDELLKCLQEVPLDVLVLAPRKFQDWLVTPAVVFGPVIEPETAKGAYLTADPSQIESKTPWITGISSGEGGLFASLLSTAGTGGKFEAVLKEEPQYILPKLLMLRMILAKNDVPAVSKRIQKFYFGERTIGKNTTQEIIDMVTDGWFLNGALDAVARHSGDTWLYYYDYMQSVSYNQVFGKGDIKSVCHSDILLNLFKIPQLFPKRTESEKDIKESEKILDLWTNFAKYGKPTENSALKWEPAGKGSAASKKYLYIGEEVVPKENLLPERVEFWNTVNEIGLRKKSVQHGKSSSRKVVIRNINYIASNRNEQSDHSSTEDSSSDEDGSTDAGSLRKQVEEAVGSWERHRNSTSRSKKKRDGKRRNNSGGNISNGASKEDIKDEATNIGKNWDIFQNILMQDADSRSDDTGPKNIQEEYSVTKKMTPSTDSLLVSERHLGHEDEIPRQNMGEEKRLHPVTRRESTDEELLFSHRTQEPKGYPQSILSNSATERVVVKSQKEEDWYVGNLQNKSTYQGKSSDQSIFIGDYASASHDAHLDTGKDKKGVLFDDSIVVQAHSVDTSSDYHQQTDIFMVSDIVGAEQVNHNMPNHVEDKRDASEPNDLFMVLGRDSATEQVSASRNPEMYDESDVFLSETRKSNTDVRPASADTKLQKNGEGTNKRISKDLGRKAVSKEPKSKPSVIGSLGRTKSDTSSRIKKSPSTLQKSKAEKDEENRKKLEQSLLQRQKRIAERSSATGLTKPTSRKNPKESATSSKVDKPKLEAPTEATNRLHKPVFKSSTIERLASAKTAKDRSTESKAAPSKKPSQKENKVIAPSKISAGKESKQGPRKSKPSDTKVHGKDHSSSDPPQKEKDSKNDIQLMSNERVSELRPHISNEIVDAKNTEEVRSTPLNEKKIDTPMLSAEHSIDDNKQSSNKAVKFLLPEVETSKAVDNATGVTTPVTSSVSNMHLDRNINLDPPVSREILSNEVSTPPPNTEMNVETNQGRRKWTTDESSLNVTKGFRKLLYFGRRN